MRFTWRLVPSALALLAVPLAAQQEVPMRGNTPVAPQGIKVPPLPDAPVRYETAEGQNIRVSVFARGFTNGWSMAFVSILLAERGGQIKVVRNGRMQASERWLAIRSSLTNAGEQRMVPVRGYEKGWNVKFAGTAA